MQNLTSRRADSPTPVRLVSLNSLALFQPISTPDTNVTVFQSHGRCTSGFFPSDQYCIHEGPKQVLQLRLETLQDMHVQGLVDLGLMSLWQDALRHHFGNLPDFSANTITDTDPYRFLGRSARQPFVHGPTGEDLGCFSGTVVWFQTSTNEYHVKVLEDGDELAFAEAELQIATVWAI